MSVDLEKDLQQFFYERQDKLTPDKLPDEYKEAKDKIYDIFKQSGYEGPSEYDEAMGIILGAYANVYYKAGFEDGIKFMKFYF